VKKDDGCAVKEWMSTEEVCSGDGGHSRKGDGWGRGQLSIEEVCSGDGDYSRKGDGWGQGQLSICCDQFNVNIIIY